MELRIGFILLLLMFNSCDLSVDESEFSFSKEVTAFFSAYKEKQIIVFKNDNNEEIDSLFISYLDTTMKKEKGYIMAQRAHFTVKIKQVFSIQNMNDNSDIMFLLMSKDIQDSNRIELMLRYKKFYSSIDYEDLHSINGVIPDLPISVDNYYTFKPDYPERVKKEDDIKLVYWTEKYGLTAYLTKGNTLWYIDTVRSDL